MRSYIFTKREREVLKSWLKSPGEVDLEDIAMTLSRIKHFRELRDDAMLYVRVCEKLGISKQES